MSRARHLVVMAAGTGGHVIPGLAVAREMQARGWTVSWLGTPSGLEQKLVPPSGLPMDVLAFTGLRGKGWLHSATGSLRLLKAFWDSLRILRARRADAVLGMGGYVCVPGGLMAWLLRKPLVLVNADAALLLSNQALGRVADRIAFGFDGADALRAGRRGRVTGNPVRAEIEALPAPAERYAGRSGPLKLLVVGGSLGARVLNETLPRALALLAPAQRPRVLHQTGAQNRDAVQAAYRAAGLDPRPEAGLEVRAFIEDMAGELAAADLVIGRAGAITVSELCAAGVPSLLVPFIARTTAHQRDNAQFMAQHGAALHLPQTELSPERLAATLAGLDRSTLLPMAERARALARPRAAARVADELEELTQS